MQEHLPAVWRGSGQVVRAFYGSDGDDPHPLPGSTTTFLHWIMMITGRGRLTTHKVYGEAMGVLSGVALLNYAYETMFLAFSLTAYPERVIRALCVMSEKTGIYGMLGGQSVDVENDGTPLAKEMLDYIYRNKTSALIEAAMMTGADPCRC